MQDSLDEWRRRVSDALLSDESLTDELNDDEAEALIRWGLAQLETITAQVAARISPALTSAAAPGSGDLDAKADAVRQIMKAVNRLTARRADLTPDVVRARVASLAALGAQLKGAPPAHMTPTAAPPSEDPTEGLLRGDLSDTEALNLLLRQIPLTSLNQSEEPPDEPTDDDHDLT